MYLNQSKKECEVILNELKANIDKVNKSIKYISYGKAMKNFVNVTKSKKIQENEINYKDLKE